MTTKPYRICVKCGQERRIKSNWLGCCRRCYIGYDISETVLEKLHSLEICPRCKQALTEYYDNHTKTGSFNEVGIGIYNATYHCPICLIFQFARG